MEPKDQSEQIEQYLLNRMDDEEKAEFEALMKTDPALAEDVKIQQELFELSEDDDFSSIYSEIKAQDEAYHQGQQKTKKNWLLISIALLILAAILFYFYTTRF